MNPVARTAVTLLDHWFLLRPVLLTPVWAAYLLGSRAARHAVSHGSRSLEGAGEWRLIPGREELEGLLLVTLLTGALYILNQLLDRRVDRVNRKLFLLSEGIISPVKATAEGVVLTVVLVAAAHGLASFEEKVLLTLAGITGILYSVPPVRLKARAGGDVAANALCYGGFTFLLGWLAGRGPGGEGPALIAGVAHALPYVFASGALFLLSTLEDLPGDRLAGLGTSAVVWGARGVRIGTLVLAAATLVSAASTREWPALAWSLLAIPLYVQVLRRARVDQGYHANQIAGRALVLAAVPGALALGAVIAVLVMTSRIYYRKRFGLRYPRLTLHPGGPAFPPRVDTDSIGG